MESEAGNQPKRERSRTRWTASLDKIFADLVVKQIHLGNRPNNVFDKKTWNNIREEFNKQTDLNFNNNQLRKHLDVLRTRFYNFKSSYDQNNDFNLDDSCCIGFDLWEDLGVSGCSSYKFPCSSFFCFTIFPLSAMTSIASASTNLFLQAQPRPPETIKVKDCPIYEQLRTIFSDSSADGKYAQSSHYGELDKSAGTENAGLSSYPSIEAPRCENQPPLQLAQVCTSPTEKAVKIPERKKKRLSETESSSGRDRRDQETCNAMAKAMLEMIAASKLRTVVTEPSNNRFTITNCIKALDEIQGIDQHTYFAALDLFEEPKLRETFISLKGEKIRLTWLQGKCGKTIFC